ncbi:protein CBFA2T1-like isoform X2 [Ornithodoros turicata]|uniref:protein CBFA2T1-like isoform X2 n=1 Tax=Ornithodoros turicata TaxID=34597 RepID=UPI0031396B13
MYGRLGLFRWKDLAAATTPTCGVAVGVGGTGGTTPSKMPDTPQDVKPLSPTQLPKVSSMQGVNGVHSPATASSLPTTGGRSLSPPTENPGDGTRATHGSSGVSSSTAPGGDSTAAAAAAVAAVGARQLSKVKRFLTTLQQFGSDVSPEVGERVHGLILGLVSSTISIEEFHHSIQEITNYPLRPFVVPFLKSHLPLLQAELLHFARVAKQSPAQYLRQHETLVLDPLHQGGEPFEIFQPESVKETSGKRRSPQEARTKENGHSTEGTEGGPPPTKRHQTALASPGSARLSPGAHGHGPAPPAAGAFRFEDSSVYRDRYDRYDRFDRDFYRPYYGMLHREYTEDRDMEDEWKNINTMLNCILGMVEKTKRAIAILQHRSQSERQDFGVWGGRRHLEVDFDMKKRDLMAHYKTTAELDRVSEVRRRAEEAVNEVKRQAVAELQKAVSAAESKASELVAAERTKMERLISEARRQAAEEALAAINHQEDSTEQNCWNCGRKANETCSGCNVARYCGAFCQHKDWENHHRVCGQPSSAAITSAASPMTPTSTAGKRSPSPPRRAEAKIDSRH